MPYIEGESLRARVTLGPLPVAETTSILRDVTRALAYAHERGVIHRDIKPDNVLEMLERALKEREPFLYAASVSPQWYATLRSEPRFQAIARELGLDRQLLLP